MKNILTLFILLNVFLLNAQQKTETTTINTPKLYLHTDREFYFRGDTLWFAAYYLNGKSQTFEFESCNLYTEIINQKGEIILSGKFILQNGFCSGYVPLSDTIIKDGNFLLRAYTDYLKNFGGDAFFSKTIQVSLVKSSMDLVPPVSEVVSSSDTTVINCTPEIRGTMEAGGSVGDPAGIGGKIDISFLPEGGFLLSDVSNCVAFKAVDKNGFGKNISGEILDEKDNLVLTFKSMYKGVGKFYFYPKTGKSYTAKIDGFPDLKFQLPEIKETGGKLMLVNQEKKKIQMVVQSKSYTRILPYLLIGYHKNDELFSIEIDRKKANQIIKINSILLKDGINRLVLHDKNLIPISERLVFKQPEEINQIEIELNEKNFSTRQEVELALLSNNKYKNELAQVSVAVIDENYINASGISQNIASSLLLDSELKGHIEAPAECFVSDSLDSQTKLDLLMCINGWSNYLWNYPPQDVLPYKPLLGYTFSGNVKRFTGKKVLTEGNVSMILFKNDSIWAFYDQPLDLNGNFKFRNIVFYDSASVFVQARNKNDNHNLKFEVNLPEFISPQISSLDTLQLKNDSNIPVSVFRQRYINEMRLKEFFPEKNSILIKEVEVSAKSEMGKTQIMDDFFGPGDKTVAVESNDATKYGTLTLKQYLMVKGIFVRRGSNLTYLDSSKSYNNARGTKILLDGTPTDIFRFDDPLYKLGNNLNMIKRIEVFDGASASIFGFGGADGVINIISKKGEDFRNEPAHLFGGTVEKVIGLTPLREFYSPKYTPANLNTEAPDYRNTLYWNPKVNIEDGGRELSFFTCDNVSRYKIFVEGITESGKICTGTGEFVVDRFLSSPDYPITK